MYFFFYRFLVQQMQKSKHIYLFIPPLITYLFIKTMLNTLYIYMRIFVYVNSCSVHLCMYFPFNLHTDSQLNAVYDLTVAYPITLPVNETDILKGKIPEEVHFNICRHGVETLPKDEEGIKTWCEQRWAEKEASLKKFYSIKPDDRRLSSRVRYDRPWNAMYLALVSWTAVTVFTLYLTFCTTWGFYYTCFSILGFVLVSYFTYGIQNFEIDLFRKYDCPPESVSMGKEQNGYQIRENGNKKENLFV